MVNFLMISKHAPVDCPLHNEKTKKMWMDYVNAVGEIEKKYGTKSVGVWSDIPAHTVYMVVEAPSAEIFQKSLMEPLIMQLILSSETQIKMVLSQEESMKLMK